MLISEARRIIAPHFGPSCQRKPFAIELYRQHLLARLKEFDVMVTWVTHDRAYAKTHERKVFCRWPVNETTIATLAHETGHCTAEPCGGHGHYRDPKSESGCLKCEVNAWAHGIALVRPYAWTKLMHRRLMYCIGTYRCSTPGYGEVKATIDALARKEVWYSMRDQQAGLQGRRVDVLRARLQQAMGR